MRSNENRKGEFATPAKKKSRNFERTRSHGLPVNRRAEKEKRQKAPLWRSKNVGPGGRCSNRGHLRPEKRGAQKSPSRWAIRRRGKPFDPGRKLGKGDRRTCRDGVEKKSGKNPKKRFRAESKRGSVLLPRSTCKIYRRRHGTFGLHSLEDVGKHWRIHKWVTDKETVYIKSNPQKSHR